MYWTETHGGQLLGGPKLIKIVCVANTSVLTVILSTFYWTHLSRCIPTFSDGDGNALHCSREMVICVNSSDSTCDISSRVIHIMPLQLCVLLITVLTYHLFTVGTLRAVISGATGSSACRPDMSQLAIPSGG